MEGEVVSVGQARRFEEFYQACYGRLLRQVAPVTTDLADAEDVLQEAFARAAIRWRRLETYDAPEAWVLRVGMNVAGGDEPCCRHDPAPSPPGGRDAAAAWT
jgi:DNA-directed RNA polymerase specialized sigma24 family protein